MSGYDTYKTPLDSRYASDAMKQLFSQRSRHSMWRQLWVWLAEAEQELGIDSITDEALDQMRSHITLTDDDFKAAAVEEQIRRHDVMAHVHAFGAVAPAAAGIIHTGATSCYVTDNAELILMRNGMDILLPKLARVINTLVTFAKEWKNEPTLGYTHYQPAQMITVGKRAVQWAQELMMDLEDIEHARDELKFRGAQGTTGTQASFMELFNGDGDKVDRLNELLCAKSKFPSCYTVSTQTYTRKVDLRVSNAIAGLGVTAQKMTSDIRHLANMKELEEPFEKTQIGSSAMAYKRNPMRSERICSLGRKLAGLPANFANTFSTQWMERSLDDSAIRRIDIPEMFLLADAVLIALDNVTNGLVVYPKRIESHNRSELPFMVTENIIMKTVAKGGSRQEAHEVIRVLSHEASYQVKHEGKENDLVERMKAHKYFEPVWDEIDAMLDPKLYTGRSAAVVDKFADEAAQKLKPYESYIMSTAAAQLNI